MNTLVLIPKARKVVYSYLEYSKVFLQGTLPYCESNGTIRSWNSIMTYIVEEMKTHNLSPDTLDAIAIRVVFGGSEFDGPQLVDPLVIRKLQHLVPRAPLHIPQVLDAIESCKTACTGKPIALVFETSFFVKLAAREHKYALDNTLMNASGIRRYGYRGLLHKAASRYIAGIQRKRGEATARILSICLEPRPEIAAVVGLRPVMVTSGATPLEGLPSEKSCGEIDPSIVITLAQAKQWGPEKINMLLTRQSGVAGLAGNDLTLEELFWATDERYRLAREVLKYRILLACGAGIAAMGGVDCIIFSGRYAMVGNLLGPWLRQKLSCVTSATQGLSILFYTRSIEQLIAEEAALVILEKMTDLQFIQ